MREALGVEQDWKLSEAFSGWLLALPRVRFGEGREEADLNLTVNRFRVFYYVRNTDGPPMATQPMTLRVAADRHNVGRQEVSRGPEWSVYLPSQEVQDSNGRKRAPGGYRHDIDPHDLVDQTMPDPRMPLQSANSAR